MLTISISDQDVGANLRQIHISGLLDSLGANSVSAQLVELVAEPKKGVVVNLSALQFLASTGIGALIASARSVQKRGGKRVLVAAEGSIPVFTNSVDAEQAVAS